MADLAPCITQALYAIRRIWRRRVELTGTDPYTWRRTVRRARLGPSVKLVACLLADYANPDGTSIRPGNERLTAVSELSDKTVRTALSKLRDKGLIERTFAGSKLGRRGLADEYRLTFPVDLVVIGDMLPVDEATVEDTGTPVTMTGDEDGTPVTATDDPASEPVDNPDPDAPSDSGTPVTDARTPVTDDRNTGNGYRPPNQAPTSTTPTNKPSGSGDHNLSWKGETILVSDTERNDLESSDEDQRYKAANAILMRRNDLGHEFMQQATKEMPDAGYKRTVIRAAQICLEGIPA